MPRRHTAPNSGSQMGRQIRLEEELHNQWARWQKRREESYTADRFELLRQQLTNQEGTK